MSGPRLFDTRPRGEASTFRQPTWLSDAIRATVRRTRGLAKCIAIELGCKENHVNDLADPFRRVPLKAFEIVAITNETRDFTILDALEAQVGRVGYQLPAASVAGASKEQARAQLVAAFSALFAADATDAAELPRTIDALLQRTCEFRTLVSKTSTARTWAA